MSVINFENKFWRDSDQKIVYRHKAALGLIGDNSGKILDLGCGDGLFLKLLKDRGIDGLGVDFSEIAVKKCREKGLEAEIADIAGENLPFGGNAFGSVAMLDVLEHLYFPEDLLKEAKRVSKKNIIVSVPNFNSLPARIQTFLGRIPENNRPNKGHVHWFNYKILRKMLSENNLEIVEMKMNTFWENKILIGKLLKILLHKFPSIFALSFTIKAKKRLN